MNSSKTRPPQHSPFPFAFPLRTSGIDVFGGIYGMDVGHGWMRYVHVNGGIYFYHSRRKIITDNNMANPRWRHAIESAWEEWMQAYEEDGIMEHVQEDADIILRYGYGACDDDELPEPEDLPEMYFVSQRDGTETRQASGPDLIVEENTYRYWTHVEEYPMHLKPDYVLPRARACFLHAMTYLCNERIFESKHNVIDLTASQITRFMEIYSDLSETYDSNPAIGPILIWFLARVVREVKSVQGAVAMQCSMRTTEGMLGYAVKRPAVSLESHRTWQLHACGYMLGALLFGSHHSYRTRLENTRFGRSVYLGEFRSVLGQFLEEWTDSNLLATVLIGADVTFLTLPGISSFARTACLLSSIFSIVSIGAGLYHVWHHRTKLCVDSLEAAKYVYHVEGQSGKASDLSGPLIMSFFLALPVGSMMWALLCFFVALAAFCDQSNSPRSLAMVVLLVVFGVVIAVGIAMVLYFLERKDRTHDCRSK